MKIGFTNKKYIDTDYKASVDSKLYQYWNENGFTNFYSKWRKPKFVIPEKAFNKIPTVYTLEQYNIKNIQFGRWCNNDASNNYTLGLIVSLHDLNEVLKFKNNIGFDVLGVSFGARGSGTALAHFEIANKIINLTRFKRSDKMVKGFFSDEEKYLATGGLGSFAHEYGHFIDYIQTPLTGVKSSDDYVSFTRGFSSSTHYTSKELDIATQGLNAIANNIIYSLQRINDFTYTDYFINLKKNFKTEYWFRSNELFARSFEVYIHRKLSNEKIKNSFLTKFKYDTVAYPDNKLMDKIEPLFDKFFISFRKQFLK